jgi:membrane protein involved in colicin uptake
VKLCDVYEMFLVLWSGSDALSPVALQLHQQLQQQQQQHDAAEKLHEEAVKKGRVEVEELQTTIK